MKIKNQKIFKNGAIGAYVYQADKTWKWRIIGKQKGSGLNKKDSKKSLQDAENLLNELNLVPNEALYIIDRIRTARGNGGGGHYPTVQSTKYISGQNRTRLLKYENEIRQLTNPRNKSNLNEPILRVGMRYPTTRIPQLLSTLGISLNHALHVLDAAGCGPNGLYVENGINQTRIHITCEQYNMLREREQDIREYADNLPNINREPPQNLPKENKKRNNRNSNA